MKFSLELMMRLIDNNCLSNSISNDLQLIIGAINDWPYPIDSIEDLILELSKLIKEPLTQSSIEAYNRGLNPKVDAWQMETLTQLNELLAKHEGGFTLQQVIDTLKDRVNYFSKK